MELRGMLEDAGLLKKGVAMMPTLLSLIVLQVVFMTTVVMTTCGISATSDDDSIGINSCFSWMRNYAQDLIDCV